MTHSVRKQGMKLVAGAVALLVFGGGVPAALAMTGGAGGDAESSATLLVRLAPGLSSSEQAAVIARDGGAETGSIAALRVHLVDVPSDETDAALARYGADPQVVSAERDRTRAAGAIPSDAAYGNQWNLSAVAWEAVFGSLAPAGSATLAVLDTGVSAAGGDLSVGSGWSAFAQSDPAADPNGHGTAVASIAAAKTDNGAGIAGLDFAPTTILPVQVLDAEGLGQDSDIIQGVVWAADHGADVILMAFSSPGYSPALQDAIDYASSKGAVVVAATGNDGSSEPRYPAGDTGVIGVSGTDKTDMPWAGGNSGADTFIAAPAVDIPADTPAGGTTTISGTSAAAAMVAGAAALLKAEDPAASNAVIAGRLARSADAVGTPGQTGNGRLDLERAVADTGTDPVTPAGAPGGGPFVGPYTPAAPKFWVGCADSSWSNNNNWSTSGSATCSSGVPSSPTTAAGSVDSATITTGRAHYPDVTSGTFAVTSLQIDAGATLTISGGSLATTGTGSDLTDNGAVSISSGTLTIGRDYLGDGSTSMTGGTLQIGRDFALSSTGVANWNAPGGTVEFTTARNATTAQLGGVGAGGIQFHNVSISGTNAASLGNGGPTISISGDMIDTNTAPAQIYAAGTIRFDGSGAQAIGGTASQDFNNLTIDKPSGAVTLGIDESIRTTLTFTKGTLVTGSHTLILSNATGVPATISGAAQSTGWVAGNLRVPYTTNGGTVTFPVGTPSFYTPATFVISGGSGTSPNTALRLGATAGDHPQVSGSGINAARSVNSYWTLATVGTLNLGAYTATFAYPSGDVDAGSNQSSFVIRRFDGVAWSSLSSVSNSPGVSSTGSATLSNSVGDFAIGEPAGVTPDHFVVTAPASATAGSAFTFTVTAQDSGGNTVTGYSGTVHFTSSDGAATVPANTTLTNGTGSFPATLRTAGSQTITATDTASPVVTGTSNTINVVAAATTHFAVTAPASATAGQAFGFTVTAQDQFDNTATSYGGTVHFTTTDVAAGVMLPANSTLTGGTGTFSATLVTAGPQTITATDAVNPAPNGTSNSITVSAAAATQFAVSAPSSATAGSAFTFVVTALDQFNNTATGYGGTVHFTSSDGAAVLPANTTLTNGVGFFSATLKTAGFQTISATDTASSSVTGTSNAITVSAAAATHLVVAAPLSVTAGSPFSVTVIAKDAFENTAAGYTGTVHFTTTDVGSGVVLPANYHFTGADAGTKTLSATLVTAGSQTITATDVLSPGVTGTSSSIDVVAAAATHFVVSAPASATAGAAFTFVVTALDQFDNTATGYGGTVHFTSTDGAAVLPPNTTLSGGTGAFSATLKTAGSQLITATDLGNGSITGTSNPINVFAAAATHFAVSAPASATAGQAFSFTVTALDAFDNTATGYGGTVHFTSSDVQAVLPANVTLGGGSGTFSATLETAGPQTITATDTATPSITGTSNPITVDPGPAAYITLTLSPSTITANGTDTTTVSGHVNDAFGNARSGDTVTLTSNGDVAGTTAPTNGSGNYSAVLTAGTTSGDQTITATDGAATTHATLHLQPNLAAANDSATVFANTMSDPIDVLHNDALPAGGSISAVQSPTAAGGTASACATCVGGGRGVAYTPPTDYVGPDSFTYTITDGHGHVSNATVNVNVTPTGSLDSANFLETSLFKDLHNHLDVLFSSSPKPYDQTLMRLVNTKPDEFHLVTTITNNTGVTVDAASGNRLTAIYTIPAMPANCGAGVKPVTLVPPSSFTTNADCTNPGGLGLGDPAFVLRGPVRDVVKVSPSNPALDVQYKVSGDCSVTSSGYSPTLPANGAVKCIKLTGFSIKTGPRKPDNTTTIDIKLGLRPVGTDWLATPDPTRYFSAGFNVRVNKLITYAYGTPQAQTFSGLDNVPVVAAGQVVTAIGGYVFQNANAGASAGQPATGDVVRLYNSATAAGVTAGLPFGSCSASSVASNALNSLSPQGVDAQGFYFISKTGDDQDSTTAPTLPSGVAYYVQVCQGATAVAARAMDHKLADNEFDEEDFTDATPPRPIVLAIAHHDGKPSNGDTVQVQFSEPLVESFLCSTWGTDNTKDQTLQAPANPVTVTIQDNAPPSGNDQLVVSSVTGACGGTFHFGTLDLGSTGYVGAGGATFNQSKIQWNHNGTLTITLGALSSGTVNAVNSALRATYRPDPSLIDLAGNLIAGTASDTTTGSKDSNF